MIKKKFYIFMLAVLFSSQADAGKILCGAGYITNVGTSLSATTGHLSLLVHIDPNDFTNKPDSSAVFLDRRGIKYIQIHQWDKYSDVFAGHQEHLYQAMNASRPVNIISDSVYCSGVGGEHFDIESCDKSSDCDFRP